MKNLYIDLHVIQTVPPSCVNRDDTNSPKSAIYGGVHRARVSGQSWKHAMRKMFRERFDPRDLGQRSKDIIGLVMDQMAGDLRIDKGELRNAVREVINLASVKASKPILPDASYGGIKKALKNAMKEWKEDGDTERETLLLAELKTALADFGLAIDDAKTADAIFKAIDGAIKSVPDDVGGERKKTFERKAQKALLSSPIIDDLVDTTSDALFFMGKREAINIAELTVDFISSGQKPTKNQVQEALNYYAKGDGSSCFAVDVALFGRMVAKAPELNVDASAQVAHAISTHKVAKEFDYFTAVDDRAPKDNAGAGMIGTNEFNSSTLYRYATVAAHELCAQLGKDADATAKAVAEFVRAFVLSMPSGKINTFANHTLPDAVYVAIQSDRPVNLVGAFENPVRSESSGYAAASIERFCKYAQEVRDAYKLKPKKAYAFALGGGLDAIGDACDLDALLKGVEADVRGALQ